MGRGIIGYGEVEASVMSTPHRVMRRLRIGSVPPINKCFLKTSCAPTIILDAGMISKNKNT